MTAVCSEVRSAFKRDEKAGVHHSLNRTSSTIKEGHIVRTQVQIQSPCSLPGPVKLDLQSRA